MNVTEGKPERESASGNSSSHTVKEVAADWRPMMWAVGGLLIAFSWPLFRLVQFSMGSDLYSHILLVPGVSLYLVWLNRARISSAGSTPNRAVGLTLVAAGTAMLTGYLAAHFGGAALAREDSLALSTSAFVLLLAGVIGLLLGRESLRVIAFPLAFLAFMVPFPRIVLEGIETFLQHGSASVAAVFYSLSGTPFFRSELIFQLPGITLQVAPECSGMHSTLALFITSLVGGYFFLRSILSRTVLTLAVIPLALVRNGFRVFVIGELCVRISPDMIHSFIHRQGGPIFFALSLIPFGLLLIALVRFEKRRALLKKA
jgi:exosortase C (VPDSG-CTERM-specific)